MAVRDEDSLLSLPRATFQSLVRELRSHKKHSTVQTKKKKGNLLMCFTKEAEKC